MSELFLNLDNLTQGYKLKLAQLNEVEIGELTFYSDLTYTPALVEINELTFSMPSVYTDDWGNRAATPYYDELQADTLIIVNDTEYYYVDTCPETTQDGYSTKSVHAYGREYELSFKSFSNYEPETERFLYFVYPTESQVGFPWTSVAAIPEELKDHITSTIDKDEYYYGIFNEIERLTSWRLKLESVNTPIIPKVYSEESGVRESIATQVRKITTSESNLLDLMKQLQEAWGVYFEYDTENRTITIKALEDLLENNDGSLKPAIGVLSNENFIIDLTKDLKKQDIKTRLYLYNSNGDGVISRLTGHGQPYIEDYTYYRNPKYMSPSLLAALVQYDTQIINSAPQTRVLFDAYQELVEEKSWVEEEIAYLNEELARTVAELDPLKILKEGYISGEEIILAPGVLDSAQQIEYNRLVARVTAINQEIILRTTSMAVVRPTGNYFTVRVPVEEGETGDADGLKPLLLVGQYFSTKKLESLLTAKKQEIRAHQALNSMRKIFVDYEAANSLISGSLLSEMEPYIKETSHKSESIEDAVELYNLGRKLIKTISRPKTQFSLNALDFLSLVELSGAWYMVSLGAILRLKNTNLDFNKDALLLKYAHSPASQSLTLDFSEDLTLSSDTKFIADLIAKSSTVASQVSFNSSYWGAGGAMGSDTSGVLGNYFDMMYANEIQTSKLVAEEIFANNANIGDLVAQNITTNNIITNAITANLAKIDFAEIGELNAQKIATNEIFTETLTADSGFISKLTTNIIFTETLATNLAFITELVADTAFIDQLTSNTGFIGDLTSNSAFIGALTANTAFIQSITTEVISSDAMYAEFADIGFTNIDFALIAQAQIDNLTARIIEADSINTKYLTAAIADLKYLSSDIITANTIEANILKADLINAILMHVDTASFQTVFVEKMLTEDGFFKDLTATGLTAVKINAASITTGTLSAERILLTGGFDALGNPTGLLLSLNNLGALTSENVDSLDGYVLTNNTVHAEKIIADSITAREIAAEAITATEIAANAITSGHISTLGLDAGVIKTGILDASLVAIQSLSAAIIKTGLLESVNGAFFLDMETGDFNLGGVLVKNGDNVSIIAGGVPIEEYVDGKMLYLIKSSPEQIFINSTHDGNIENSQSFSLDFSMYKGTALKAATITGVHLQDSLGQVISTASFSYSVIHPIEGGLGKLNLTFGTGTNLPVDTGYVQCLITVTENSKQFFYKISWSKVKAGTDPYQISVISLQGNTFLNGTGTVKTLNAIVFQGGAEVDIGGTELTYNWTKYVAGASQGSAGTGKTITVNASEVATEATYVCDITE